MDGAVPLEDSDRIAVFAAKAAIVAGIPVGVTALFSLLGSPPQRLSSAGTVLCIALAGAVILVLGGARLAHALGSRGRAADGLLLGLGGALLIGAGLGASLWLSPRMWDDTPFSVVLPLLATAVPSLASALALLSGGPRVWSPAPRYSSSGPVAGILRSGVQGGVLILLLSCCWTVAVPRPFC